MTTRSGLLVLAILQATACGGSTESRRPAEPVARASAVSPAVAVEPAATGASADCATIDEAAMWSTVPAAERAGLDADGRHVVAAELDGGAPAEAVLYVDHVPEDEAEDSRSLIWVLRCAAGAWTVIGSSVLDIDDAWAGFFDGPPGIVVLRPETVPGVPHPMLRVEVANFRGSYDPRFSSRHFNLLHFVDGELVLAFSCQTHAQFVAGPDRDDVGDRLRTVTYRGGSPARIHVRVTGTDHDREIRHVAADYVLSDDGLFVPHGDDVCAE